VPQDDTQLEISILSATPMDTAADARANSDITLPLVLVAAGDADLRRYITQALLEDSRPVRVLVASDGEAAVLTVQRRSPNLVICDMDIPRLGGLGVCAVLRSAEGVRGEIPILLITSEELSHEARSRALRAGATALLASPFNARSLSAEVSRLLAPTPK
jgi:CheY-like chemotaxis protein